MKISNSEKDLIILLDTGQLDFFIWEHLYLKQAYKC